jgi:uncharacterized paraquat-inducible protein A
MAIKNARCPVCEERFEIEPDLEVGDVTACPGCYADLKVLNLHPIEVAEASNIGADNDDADDEADEGTEDEDFGSYR